MVTTGAGAAGALVGKVAANQPEVKEETLADLPSEEELEEEEPVMTAPALAPPVPPAAPVVPVAPCQAWEDKRECLISRHMVALQEDARLLTKESQLLSEVQGNFGDWNSYISQVDELIRRKVDVYMHLLENVTWSKTFLFKNSNSSSFPSRNQLH